LVEPAEFSVEERVVKHAKRYAKRRGVSVSAMEESPPIHLDGYGIRIADPGSSRAPLRDGIAT